MLNFRKLKQDFSANVLKEGKELFEKNNLLDAKILHLDGNSLRLNARVQGTFENTYECEIEIDRTDSSAIDSNCDCTYTYDCQHIAALIFYLEQHLNEIVVAYSEEINLEKNEKLENEEKEALQKTFQEAASKEEERKDQSYQKEVLHEYISAAKILGSSLFFLPDEKIEQDKAELIVIFTKQGEVAADSKNFPEIQLALRLPFRSKPLYIQNVKFFIDAVRFHESVWISGKKYLFTSESFDKEQQKILNMIIDHARFVKNSDDRCRFAEIDKEVIGALIAESYASASKELHFSHGGEEREPLHLPGLYCGSLEEPLCFSTYPAKIEFEIEYLEAPGPTLLLKPSIILEEEKISPKEGTLFESTKPGIIYKNTYYRFQPKIKRGHLKELEALQNITIPKPLFGTFIENALPVLQKYGDVKNPSIIKQFITLPYVEQVRARCPIHYLNGELEASFYFIYENAQIPASFGELEYEHLALFETQEGIIARNLTQERKLLEDIFQDFLYDEKEGIFSSKSEKKIVEFMTEVIPKFQHRVEFECPENLLDQFIYDQTNFELSLKEGSEISNYEVSLSVDGFLKGITLDRLWECLASKKTFLELSIPTAPAKKSKVKGKLPRILVLDLEKLSPLVQIFDEIGIDKLDDHSTFRPLWSLTTLSHDQFKSLPIKFKMSSKLKEMQKQMLGEEPFSFQEVPKEIRAVLRNYQVDGIKWLERLRKMHLNGILADDMGLGKTLQAIIAVTQSKLENKGHQSLVVCPTSLVYNWKEEFSKFNPGLKVLVIDSIPQVRKKLLKSADEFDVLITSYNLLQKDVESYVAREFDYAILDEAQHIKNRGTRNAKSVKMINAKHKLILTGTPIENSLEELWSLFDFLMPGLLSSYDRFVEKYIRNSTYTVGENKNLENLRRKVSPFILRRMKEDVLDDLPPVSEIVYHCHLSDTQKELYHSYAQSAKEELSRLVKKEGFDKIQIHVLATLTRLKQICCHPAIFAKEKAEEGDSAKYDMLMELIASLIEGNHKTVIFSQYTKMLTILREDLISQGIKFAYLDGSSKNRLEIVKEFNESPKIPIFLVSLKAGGAGLNLVGADTVIHYDLWWNPAVENQATDRVHRIGQKKSVSSYKLITLDTIEEKILTLQNRKKELVKKLVTCDEEAIGKLTWEEVLELLQT